MTAEKPKVLISHSSTDNLRVRDLERSLKAAGVEVWVDSTDIRGGDNLPHRISEALDWCNTLLLLWSCHSATSRWVFEEWTNAFALEKNIIPCKIDETRLPSILANKRYIDLQDSAAGVEELVKALNRHSTPPETNPVEEVIEGNITLRSTALENLSEEEVQKMLQALRFYKHDYEELERENQKLIIDHAAGLMWQQSGSNKGVTFPGPPHYISMLNNEKWGGYNDWRMPTIEEAMFLVEQTPNSDNLFIDPVFHSEQKAIWTADKKALWIWWAVNFATGSCYSTRVEEFFHVRAVRDMPK